MPAALPLTRDAILQFAQTLPSAPQVLGGLCELLEDVNTDLDQIAEEIRTDPALAARVMQLGNSVMFGGGGRIGSVEEAVNRVGFAEIVRLVGIATVAGLVERSLGAYAVDALRFRETLLLHALASEALARHTAVEPRAAYAGGLLRGVGMMVLDRAARAGVGSPEVFDPAQHENWSAWEQSRFGVTAVEVTTMVLDEWRFPSDIVAAIERHLAPDEAPFANILNLAGAVVADHELALSGEAGAWSVTPEKLAAAGLDEEQWQDASVQAASVFARQRPMLS